MNSFSDDAQQQAQALADYLLAQRETILTAWASAVNDDPTLANTSHLTRAQFRDHIPEILDYFDKQLRQLPDGTGQTLDLDQVEHASVSEHGLHRWQQGYALGDVIREWGHLHLSLVEAVNTFSQSLLAPELAVVIHARLQLAALLNEGVWESVTEYDRVRQAEAAGRLRDLEQTLESAAESERQRGEDLRVAAHDLRGSLTVLDTTAQLLQLRRTDEPRNTKMVELLQTGVSSLHRMMNDLMDLARLEAGHERRVVAPFDTATLLRDLCDTARPVAEQRGLFLRSEGPATLLVEGDAIKVQRIVQNLLLNAIKYTEQGGVSVNWGDQGPERWFLSVRDTGPGFQTRSSGPMVQELKDATDIAHQAEKKDDASESRSASNPLTQPAVAASQEHRVEQGGEGVGLSIVKRLCELLDASLEMETTAGSGSTFRVLLPRQYGPSSCSTSEPLLPEAAL